MARCKFAMTRQGFCVFAVLILTAPWHQGKAHSAPVPHFSDEGFASFFQRNYLSNPCSTLFIFLSQNAARILSSN